jgi:Fe-S-cluster containining protein
MADVALMAIQLRGKLRRYVQANVLKQDTEALLAKRQGECNRCGACCKILFRCPFLGTDASGQYTCQIYDNRFAQCRLFPLHAADLREVSECSFTFVSEPSGVREPAAAE